MKDDGMWMSIDNKLWKELANVGAFALSLESMDALPRKMLQGKVVFSGMVML